MTVPFPELLHYLFAFYFWDPDNTDDIEVVCDRGSANEAVARLRTEVKRPNNLAVVESVELGLLEVSEDEGRAIYCTLRTIGEKLVVVERAGATGWKILGCHWDEKAAREMLAGHAEAVPA
jgi:hypothetical protein